MTDLSFLTDSDIEELKAVEKRLKEEMPLKKSGGYTVIYNGINLTEDFRYTVKVNYEPRFLAQAIEDTMRPKSRTTKFINWVTRQLKKLHRFTR